MNPPIYLVLFFKQYILIQAPAVDVIGVGLENGKIIIHNIKFDETIMSFSQDWGPITTLSFRTG